MQQAQNFAKLLQGYVVPSTVTKQAVGSQGYSNSPLSQISGLLTLLSSFGGGGGGTAAGGGSSALSDISQGLNVADKAGNLVTKYLGADGGMVSDMSPEAAYTDGQGNFYDVNGYLVE
jgi:hypothetical protein